MQLWELRRENLPLTREINLFALVVLKKSFYTRRLRPKFQPSTLLYTIFDRLGTPLVYLLQSNLWEWLTDRLLQVDCLILTCETCDTNKQEWQNSKKDRLIRKDTGLTNVRVIQENEASQKAEYLSHDKLNLICFYLFLGQKKKVKNNLTPYTVWPVALVWYVFYSSQSEVKTIINNSLAPRKRWPRPLRSA